MNKIQKNKIQTLQNAKPPKYKNEKIQKNKYKLLNDKCNKI